MFPKAEVMVPATEWAFWMDDGTMTQAPEGMKGGFQGVRRVFGPIAKDVKRYEAGKEIVPGLTVVAAPGPHARPHRLHALLGQGKLMIMSDITNHPALFVRNPDWSAVFDMDGDQAARPRRRMLDMAASERAQVSLLPRALPGHRATSPRTADRFRFVPVQWSPAI